MRIKDELYREALTQVGASIFDYCKEQKITRAEFAEKLGINYVTLQYKMQGKRKGFTKPELALIRSIILGK